MNRDETRKAIEVMQAWVDGASIQYSPRRNGGRSWEDTSEPWWAWDVHEYRTKPEPREWYVSPGVIRAYGEIAGAEAAPPPQYIRVREVLDDE